MRTELDGTVDFHEIPLQAKLSSKGWELSTLRKVFQGAQGKTERLLNTFSLPKKHSIHVDTPSMCSFPSTIARGGTRSSSSLVHLASKG